MANELQVPYYVSGATLYAIIRNLNADVWNGTAFVPYVSANYATYVVPLVEQGAAEAWVGTFPPLIASGIYRIYAYLRFGATPAETDGPRGYEPAFQWFGAITGSRAIHERIRDAVAATVATFPLNGIPVYSQEQYVVATLSLPCVTVTYEAGSEAFRGGTNERDDVAYPVLIGLHGFGPINRQDVRPQMDPIEFRERMRVAFNNKRLPAVCDVYQCEFVAQPLIDINLPQYQKLNTAVGITAVTRIFRTHTFE